MASFRGPRWVLLGVILLVALVIAAVAIRRITQDPTGDLMPRVTTTTPTTISG